MRGGATKDKTVVTDQKEEKKAEEKKTETKVQTETNEELIKTKQADKPEMILSGYKL